MLNKFIPQIKKNLTDKTFWINNLKTIGLMLAVVFVISSYQQRDMITGAAPALQGQLSSGENFQLSEQANKPTLVYFWGSWCGICKTTSPFVSSLALDNPESSNSPYNIISVALSSGDNDEITEYLNKNDYQFNAVNDDNGRISKNWGVAVTPSIFILNAKGDIKYISTGMTSSWGMKLRLWLASL